MVDVKENRASTVHLHQAHTDSALVPNQMMELPFIGKKVNRRTPWIVGLLAAGLLSISTGTYFVVRRATPKVDIAQLTVPVEPKNVSVRIEASGKVVPIQSVNLSPKTSGRLTKLYVEQGDLLEQGQIIARMDNADLLAQVAQAQANLQQAEAQLAKARAGSRPEEIAQARARLAQAEAQLTQARSGRPEDIAQARARLAQAEAQLMAAQTTSPEEIAQAKAQIEAAKARVDLANQRLQANQDLARQGAISRDRLQEVVTEYRTTTASLQEAQRRLAQVQNGTNPALIAQRQAAVVEARQALQALQSGARPEEIAQRQAMVQEARQALQQLQNGTRREDIAQAQAVVAEAKARLQAVQVQMEDTVIRAPFSGIVTQKYATEGAFVTPTTSASSTTSATSTSIVALARGLEILANVPEVNVGQIRPNQPVEIVADAYPDRVFKGQVRLVAPEAVVEQNVTSFQVRVAIDTGKEELRSGMNVNLTFLGNEVKDALMVPTVAIVTEGGRTGVLMPDTDNKPQFRPVTIGTQVEDETQILEGVKTGDRVFIDLPKDYKQKQEK